MEYACVEISEISWTAGESGDDVTDTCGMLLSLDLEMRTFAVGTAMGTDGLG